jgi:hypothetical protein
MHASNRALKEVVSNLQLGKTGAKQQETDDTLKKNSCLSKRLSRFELKD